MFTELAPKLFFIDGDNSGRFPNSNGLLIESKYRVLVDTGFGRSRREAILAGGKVDIIINTHFHLDHAYGNRHFPKAQIWAHRLDALPLSSQEMFMAYTGFDSLKESPNELIFPGGMLAREVTRELEDGEMLDFGEIILQVIHTPGHTPGHISLFEPKHKVLFSGDIDLTSFGPWYGNIRSDLDAFSTSIDKLIALEPQVFVSSHAGIIRDRIPEKLREYAAKVDKREELILKHLSQAKTMNELVEDHIIFPRYPEPQLLYRFFEQTMLEKHVQRLVSRGKVVRKPNDRFKACC